MVSRRAVACPENNGVATFLFEKWEEMAMKDTFTDRLDATLSKAYKNLCDHKDPINDLKDASKIKGIGNWTLTLLKEYFERKKDEYASSQEIMEPRAKKGRGSGRYLPQKSSAPYAILVTLYRATQNGKEYMLKQELIDAAEASGLSRMPIGPSKSGALSGRFPAKDWYSGWNSMKTLISKGLVVKSSCPAKYMLTEEGKTTGRECLERSGMLEEEDTQICSQQITEASSSEHSLCGEMLSLSSQRPEENAMPAATKTVIKACPSKRKPLASKEDRNRPSTTTEFVDKEQFATLSLRVNQGLSTELPICSVPYDTADKGEAGWRKSVQIEPTETSNLRHSIELSTSTLRPCASSNLSHHHQKDADPNPDKVNTNVLAMPPLENSDRFSDLYDLVLILDDREQFGRDNRGGNSRQKVAERLNTQFQIQVEIRRLPIGDATWIARHKQQRQEYVLDFIIERKKVDDLSHSIKDNRYKDQKLRLMRCGIQRLIYLIEGDANLTDASESIKSAAFTTEIHEGFDIQRTRDLADTVRKYGNLTHAVKDYYSMAGYMNRNEKSKACMTFDEFVTKCRDLEKETVSDVFGVQLMQVPQVTEDVALAVLDRYPTVLSLAQAYSHLEGNLDAQEKLLKDIPIRNQSKLIGGVISKNIYKLIWGDGK